MIAIKSPNEMAKEIAARAKAKRLRLNLSQQILSERSGVKYGTLKKFEQMGQLSLESLLKVALVLGELEPFENLFIKQLPRTLDQLLNEHDRKRG